MMIKMDGKKIPRCGPLYCSNALRIWTSAIGHFHRISAWMFDAAISGWGSVAGNSMALPASSFKNTGHAGNCGANAQSTGAA